MNLVESRYKIILFPSTYLSEAAFSVTTTVKTKK